MPSAATVWSVGPDTHFGITLQAGVHYHFGFMNNPTGDMSGPSVYEDTNARTVGIATFDDPHYEPTKNQEHPLLSARRATWQAQWMLACTAPVPDQVFVGKVEMPAQDTVDGYQAGYWQGDMGSGGSATSRVTLSQACNRPRIGYHQHAGSDASINGMYFITDEMGAVLARTLPNPDLCNQDGCTASGDCWCPDTRFEITLEADARYHFGIMNNPTGDMSGPSVYEDTNARSVGIATFHDPRYNPTSSQTVPTLSSQNANFQAQWMLDCAE